MDHRIFGALTIGAVLLLAGCVDESDVIATSSTDPLPGVLDLAGIIVDEHDHADPALHAASRNMETLMESALNEDLPDVDFAFGELDAAQDILVAATLAPAGGFVVLDISDPAAPRFLSRYLAPGIYTADVKLSDDAKTVFIGAQPAGQTPQNPFLAPGNAVQSEMEMGIQVVDISDPANPRLESYLPVPARGCHMLDVHTIGGATHLFCIGGRSVEISRLEDGPRKVLVPVGGYATGGTASAPPVPPTLGGIFRTAFGGAHDITVYDDLIEGKPIMYVAGGSSGVHIVDVSDPRVPKALGIWTGNEDESGKLYTHTVMTTFAGDRRITIATPEQFSHEQQPPMWILDTTDLTKPTLVGEWRLPGEHGYDKDYMFSTHNFNVVGDRVYLAHFHAGVWTIDISVPEAPQVTGVYVPDGTGATGAALGLETAPLVWDALPYKGVVYVLDIPTGLYVVKETNAPPAPEAAAP